MKACKQVEAISSRVTKINKAVNQEAIVGRRRKRAVSPTMSSSIEFRESSLLIQQNFPTNREKSAFSSQCETTEASLVEAYASIQSQDNVLANRNIDDESSMYVNDQLTNSSKFS